MKFIRWAFPLALVACGSSGNAGFGATGGDGGVDASSPVGDAAVFGTNDGEAGAPPVVAHLTGKVLAPEGTIPISGALVYLANAQPAPIPNGVYCDKCVELSPDTAYTYSNADGTFDLGAY